MISERSEAFTDLVRRLICILFLIVGLAALAFTIDTLSPSISFAFALPVATVLFAAICLAGYVFRSSNQQTVDSDGKIRWLLVAVLALGLLVRLAWVAEIPPVQISDYRRYLEAARTFLATGSYEEEIQGFHLRAFSPPGLPLFLAVGIRLLGDHSWTPAFLNLVLYLIASLLLFKMVAQLADRKTALWAALILALWPSHIALTGLAASEPLFVCLLLGGCFFIFLPSRTAIRYAPLCGIAAGLAALTRPTALTLPALWVVGLLLYGRPFMPRLKSVALATLCLMLTLAPWTVRNYRVLSAFVPVSTNGGDVFYRANNPLATGSWTPRGERDLVASANDEVRWNRLGYSWGMSWIRAHPVSFVKLAVRKQFIFLSSDETGVYWAVARGYPSRPTLYRLTLLASNLWWLLLWCVALFAVVRHWKHFAGSPARVCLLVPLFYFLAVHSVFESQSRYHVPAVPFLISVAAMAFVSGSSEFGIKQPLPGKPDIP